MMNLNINWTDVYSSVITWLETHGLSIILIIVGAIIVNMVGTTLITTGIRRVIRPEKGGTHDDEKQREDTLIAISRASLRVLVWVAVVLMILSEAGLNIGPLLAAAGVAGIALGFGGQYLIKDLISGFFIIMENQYRIGDVVTLDNTGGLVEDVTLRATVMRDLDGTVHHIPNGTISRVSNLSKYYSRVNMNIGVDYSSDLEMVIKVVNETGLELANDPAWKDLILKPIQFLRVDDFGDSAIIIKLLGDTKPIKQWDVAGEFRKRIKIAFDKAGIVIPFPQQVNHEAKHVKK
jgi:small conductance mechanosensitive channel